MGYIYSKLLIEEKATENEIKRVEIKNNLKLPEELRKLLLTVKLFKNKPFIEIEDCCKSSNILKKKFPVSKRSL